MTRLILIVSRTMALFLVIITAQNTIKNKEGFFGHTTGVALKCKFVEKYASALSKCQERTVTQLASQNINPTQVTMKRP